MEFPRIGWPAAAKFGWIGRGIMRSKDTLTIACTSPLVLADKLISLAEMADLAGYRRCAEQLILEVYEVLDDAAALNRPTPRMC